MPAGWLCPDNHGFVDFNHPWVVAARAVSVEVVPPAFRLWRFCTVSSSLPMFLDVYVATLVELARPLDTCAWTGSYCGSLRLLSRTTHLNRSLSRALIEKMQLMMSQILVAVVVRNSFLDQCDLSYRPLSFCVGFDLSKHICHGF